MVKSQTFFWFIYLIYFNHHFREFPIKHSTLFQWQQLHMSHVWSFLLGLPTCCLFTVASGGIGYTYFSLCHLMYTPWCLYNQNNLTAYFQNIPCYKTMHDICYLMICFAKLELNIKIDLCSLTFMFKNLVFKKPLLNACLTYCVIQDTR